MFVHVVPLQIAVDPPFSRVTAPQTARFQCVFRGGGPAETITWSRQTEEVPKNSAISNDGETLTILETSCATSGQYVCTVETKNGQKRQAFGNLSVVGE